MCAISLHSSPTGGTRSKLRRSGGTDCPSARSTKASRYSECVGSCSAGAASSPTPKHTHAPPFPDPGVAASLRTVFASERIEVVHAHNWLLHSFLPLKRADGPRFVVSLHDLSLVCATKGACIAANPAAHRVSSNVAAVPLATTARRKVR